MDLSGREHAEERMAIMIILIREDGNNGSETETGTAIAIGITAITAITVVKRRQVRQ